MSTYVVAKQISSLFRDFDKAFPDRDHRTDGTIGNPAHQAEVSGHNPDDTAGVQAEYSDADTKPEVRAGDIDVNLNADDGTDDTVQMQRVLDRIIATPNDIRRLKYLIFNRRLASRNTGWKWIAYTGSDPHTNHSHASGDPLFDEDDSPYASILSFEGGDMTPSQAQVQNVMNYRLNGLCMMLPTTIVPANGAYPAIIEPNKQVQAILALTASDEEIKALVHQAITEASNDPTVVGIELTPEQIHEMTDAVVAGVAPIVPTAQQVAEATVAEIAS